MQRAKKKKAGEGGRGTEKDNNKLKTRLIDEDGCENTENKANCKTNGTQHVQMNIRLRKNRNKKELKKTPWFSCVFHAVSVLIAQRVGGVAGGGQEQASVLIIIQPTHT